MRLAGTSSWRLEAKGGQLFELALFVRDALALEIAGAAEGVPPLLGPVPDLAGALGIEARAEAADQWRRWWAELLDFEFRDRHEGGDTRLRVQRLVAEHQAVCDPPAFDALADRPALQAAARAGFDAFRQWESARPSPGRDGLSGSPLDWALMKQVAEDVAFDRQVELSAVQARVAILAVQGSWWSRVGPGCVLCSAAAATDPLTAQVLLRDAFDSFV